MLNFMEFLFSKGVRKRVYNIFWRRCPTRAIVFVCSFHFEMTMRRKDCYDTCNVSFSMCQSLYRVFSDLFIPQIMFTFLVWRQNGVVRLPQKTLLLIGFIFLLAKLCTHFFPTALSTINEKSCPPSPASLYENKSAKYF